eukprot:4417688-Pyramimonas_sp.AAC.1
MHRPLVPRLPGRSKYSQYGFQDSLGKPQKATVTAQGGLKTAKMPPRGPRRFRRGSSLLRSSPLPVVLSLI